MDPDSCLVFFIQMWTEESEYPDSGKSYGLQRSVRVPQNYVTKIVPWQDVTGCRGEASGPAHRGVTTASSPALIFPEWSISNIKHQR